VACAASLVILLGTNMPVLAFGWVLLICVVMFVLIPGRMIAAMGFLTQLPAIQQRGTFMSLFSAVQMLAIGLSTILTANLISHDSQGHILYFGWIGGLAVLMGLAAILLLPKLHPASSPPAASASKG
jgi:hypothetical protein